VVILLTGGSANGKSTYAEKLLSAMPSPRIYIAAMKPYGDGAEQKIARHREMRAGKGFISVEKYSDVGETEIPSGASALLECMCNLTANEMFDDDGNLLDAHDKILGDVKKLASKCENLIIVTNEVGSGAAKLEKTIPGYNDLNLYYVNLLGRLNAELAENADEVYEVVVGIPVKLK